MNYKYKLFTVTISVLSIIFLFSSCNINGPSLNSTDKNSLSESYKSSESKESEVVMAEYKKITPQEAYEKMKENDVIILDVRTAQEYSQGHIENSLLLPVDEIKAKAENVLPDKNAVILVYCRSGNRSYHASNDLLELGYTNVFDFGGIIDWPYDTVS